MKVLSSNYTHPKHSQKVHSTDAIAAYGYSDAGSDRGSARFYRIDPVESTSAKRAIGQYQSVEVANLETAVEVMSRIDISV